MFWLAQLDFLIFFSFEYKFQLIVSINKIFVSFLCFIINSKHPIAHIRRTNAKYLFTNIQATVIHLNMGQITNNFDSLCDQNVNVTKHIIFGWFISKISVLYFTKAVLYFAINDKCSPVSCYKTAHTKMIVVEFCNSVWN